ncbi:MAG: hypothetical protein ACR652_19435, partial [Methylocystis sp.]|uniref:hypothetical protein n=1 Tax=Methylocystis sp. TaxID=1911079 RepID=UPI003DA5B4B7
MPAIIRLDKADTLVRHERITIHEVDFVETEILIHFIKNFRPILRKTVNGTRNFPTFGERKFPSLAGRAISLRGDQRLRFWAAVRGVSGSPGQ